MNSETPETPRLTPEEIERTKRQAEANRFQPGERIPVTAEEINDHNRDVLEGRIERPFVSPVGDFQITRRKQKETNPLKKIRDWIKGL